MFKNSYNVVVYACCREIFLVASHCGGISLDQVKAYELEKKQKEKQALKMIQKLYKKLNKQIIMIINK